MSLKQTIYLVAALTFACAPMGPEDGPRAGSLELSWDGGQRTIAPTAQDVWDQVSYLEIELIGPRGDITPLDPVDRDSGGVELENLDIGYWRISILARAVDTTVGDDTVKGAVLAEMTNVEALIEAGETTMVSVELAPSVGEGDMDITVVWDASVDSPSIQASLTPLGGSTTLLEVPEVGVGETSLTLSTENMLTGNYLLVVNLYTGEEGEEVRIATKMEALQIFPGILTQGSIAFMASDINSSPSEPHSGVFGTPNPGQVELLWQSGGSYTRGFIIQRREGTDGSWLEIARVTELEYLDETVVIPDVDPYEVYYRLQAFNSFGVSEFYQIGPITVNPADVPSVSGSAYNNDGLPTWNWTTPLGATGFSIAIPGVLSETDVGSDTSYTQPTPLGDGAYVFEARVNAPVSSQSGWGEYTTIVDTNPPDISSSWVNDTITRVPFQILVTAFDEPVNSVSSAFADSFWTRRAGSENVIFDGDPGPTTVMVDTPFISASSDGTYEVELYVTDNAGNQSLPSVFSFIWDTTAPDVSLSGPVPLRNSVFLFDQATVTDLVTTDPANMQYAWSLETSEPDGGSVLFGSGSSKDTTIAADATGKYTLQLRVTDEAGNDADQPVIIYWDVTPPTVDPGIDQIADEPVTFVGTVDDTLADYPMTTTVLWTLSQPPVSTATAEFSDPTSLSTLVTPSQDGPYTITLTGTDELGNSASEDVIFYYDNTPPLVDIEGDIFLSGNQTLSSSVNNVAVNGYASNVVGFSWNVASGPAADLSFSDKTVADPTIDTLTGAAGEDGVYEITLEVTDQAGNTSVITSTSTKRVFIDTNDPAPGSSGTQTIPGDLIGASSFQIQWDPATDAGLDELLLYNGANTPMTGSENASLEYRVVISQTESDVSNLANAESLSGASVPMDWRSDPPQVDGDFQWNIAGLTTQTTYYSRVLVRDYVGNTSGYNHSTTTLNEATLLTGQEIVEFRLLDENGDQVGATLSNITAPETMTIDFPSSVDKSTLTPVFQLSPGATLELTDTTTISSGVSTLDLSSGTLGLRVRAEDNSLSATNTLNVRYNSNEITYFAVGSGNAFVPTDRVGVITSDSPYDDITVDIPFRNLAGAFFKVDIRASAGATVRLDGGVQLATDPNGGSLPNEYQSTQTSTDIDFSVAGSGVGTPDFGLNGLGTFYATLEVEAENGTLAHYDLIMEETQESEIPNGTFILIIDHPNGSSFSQDLYLGAEYDNWGLNWVDVIDDQAVRYIESGAVDADSISAGKSPFHFEIQFLDGNNWSNDAKYNFWVQDITPTTQSTRTQFNDGRVLIGPPISYESGQDRNGETTGGTDGEAGDPIHVINDAYVAGDPDVESGDVVILHLLLPSNNSMDLPVDSVIIDRTP